MMNIVQIMKRWAAGVVTTATTVCLHLLQRWRVRLLVVIIDIWVRHLVISKSLMKKKKYFETSSPVSFVLFGIYFSRTFLLLDGGALPYAGIITSYSFLFQLPAYSNLTNW